MLEAISHSRRMKLVIKKDTKVGYYLFVYSLTTYGCIADYLYESLEDLFQEAENQFNVKKEDFVEYVLHHNRYLGEMENMGFKLRDSGHYSEAISVFEKIIAENPNYEWGSCFAHIAQCYDRLSDYEKAKEFYLKSIEYDDTDEYRVGNYACFLYLHGDPKEAFKWSLYLLYLEKRTNSGRKTTLEDLNALAKKIGLSDEEVHKLINDKDAANMFIKNA